MIGEYDNDQTIDGSLLLSVADFYEKQLVLLDDSRINEWALTFSEQAHCQSAEGDAVGREAIIELVKRQRRGFAGEAEPSRIYTAWQLLDLFPNGACACEAYVLVILRLEGYPLVRTAKVCVDQLLFTDGQWQVVKRQLNNG
ncbi:MAG: nuclear transport factor 2 family protein [Propionibacteriaceae bacterium]|jgi:hypothetical protein|nr:nuclear transport factor 2 family protein [Propionibacteriaceae bacterium]